MCKKESSRMQTHPRAASTSAGPYEFCTLISSFIQTVLSASEFHRIILRLVGCTTGRESHPALKNSYLFYKPMICTLKCFVKVFLIIKNNIVKEIIFLALYVVWLFVSIVIILAACTISIVSAIPATVISITSVSLVIDIVFATAAVF